MITHSRPSAVLVAWLKSTPPGTATSCLASFGPELEPESEFLKEFEDPNDELEDPNDELEDGNDLADLKEGVEEKDGDDEKEFVLEVKVLVEGEEGEEGEAGLPMMVWK